MIILCSHSLSQLKHKCSLQHGVGVGDVSRRRLPGITHRIALAPHELVVLLVHPLLRVVVQEHARILGNHHLFIFELHLPVVVVFHRRIKSEKFLLILHLHVARVLYDGLASGVRLEQPPRSRFRFLAFLDVGFVA
jgi:hypothetical protein